MNIRTLLPTYPIFSGMTLGERSDFQCLWLLRFGYFQSDFSLPCWRVTLQVNKTLSLAFYEEESCSTQEETALTLVGLCREQRLNLSWWKWMEYDEPLFFQQIKDTLCLPTRILFLLQRNGIQTVEDLRCLTEDDLRGIPGIGKQSALDIQEQVQQYTQKENYVQSY